MLMSFKDFLESSPTTRALNAPWEYPALYVGGNPFAGTNGGNTAANYAGMVKRDSGRKRRRRRKPDRRIDDFVREMELLKKDLDSLSEKRKKDRSEKPKGKGHDKPKKKAKADPDDLMRAAMAVYSNMKVAPDFYLRRGRVDRLTGEEPRTKKVSRQDAGEIARKLGIDFATSGFGPEAFRKGIEAEVREGPGGRGVRGGVGDDRDGLGVRHVRVDQGP